MTKRLVVVVAIVVLAILAGWLLQRALIGETTPILTPVVTATGTASPPATGSMAPAAERIRVGRVAGTVERRAAGGQWVSVR